LAEKTDPAVDSQIVQFTDSLKRVWRPRLNCRDMVEFEKRTGVRLFKSMYDVMRKRAIISKTGQAEMEAVGLDCAIGMMDEACGSLSNVILLFFIGCRAECQRVGLSEDQFSAAITPLELADAYGAALMCLLQWFPNLSEFQKLAQEAGFAPPPKTA
jgi:hypothetical protein